MDPTVLERESEYVAGVVAIAAANGYPDAVAWVRAQEGVVEAAGHEQAMSFRLEGGMPLLLVDAIEDPATLMTPASYAPPAPESAVERGPLDVVVGRRERQNHKQALLLQPFASFGQRDLHPRSGEARKLRLCDVPTLRDPTSDAPTHEARLTDGAELAILGTPGDGHPDALEIAVDLYGIVDPDDVSPRGLDVFTSTTARTAQAPTADPTSLYDLRFLLGDQEREIGADNLAARRLPLAELVQIDESVYRYSAVMELGMDVPSDGLETVLKVVVDLPEGGTSDYEVDVTLEGEVCYFHATLSGAHSADIRANPAKLTEESDFRVHGTADARLSEDGSRLEVLDFEGPLLGKSFDASFPTELDFGAGSMSGEPLVIPVGSTGTYRIEGSGRVFEQGLASESELYTFLSGPFWGFEDWEPLTLEITGFGPDYVSGAISGEVRDVGDFEPASAVSLDIEFRAATSESLRSECGRLPGV